jgi:hypothetical protein
MREISYNFDGIEKEILKEERFIIENLRINQI